eukprot:8938590-Ditylum_brightwellii.AAC.1
MGGERVVSNTTINEIAMQLAIPWAVQKEKAAITYQDVCHFGEEEHFGGFSEIMNCIIIFAL